VPLFEDILTLQQRAAAGAECEAACHCLMAALRLAEHQGDAEAVDRVDAAVQAEAARSRRSRRRTRCRGNAPRGAASRRS